STSAQTTSFPVSARHAPTTRPTYPLPTTVIFIALAYTTGATFSTLAGGFFSVKTLIVVTVTAVIRARSEIDGIQHCAEDPAVDHAQLRDRPAAGVPGRYAEPDHDNGAVDEGRQH